MPLFDRRTPEQKAAEARERQRLQEAEQTRARIQAERAQRFKAAQDAIEAFYIAKAPKWEYRIEEASRGWPGGLSHRAADAWNKKISSMLPSLGDEGWELVGIVPNSDFFGEGAAGLTTSEMWVFRRPRPPLPEELTKNLRDAQIFGEDELASLPSPKTTD